MHAKWMCSHIVASLDLTEKFKICMALQTLPMGGLPGCSRKIRGRIQRDSEPYDVERPIDLFKNIQAGHLNDL
ncbi:hypothetical protein PHMEG_00028745 [Phytophthora megakarya]|uniref:Uncharacterized protein n=1 Tax=Phytophthora megakarya TaxID=4795 RepID=A0A225V4A9_9STRA|nr:hypothetical protein PHMEG_00028745 [Phytophthora megakarya]